MLRKVAAVMLAVVIISTLNICAASKKIVAVMPLENLSG